MDVIGLKLPPTRINIADLRRAAGAGMAAEKAGCSRRVTRNASGSPHG
jgi:hypothetical protein